MDSFIKRFYIYQKERFPVLGHGLMIAAFSFSAIAFSRVCRGAEGFISWKLYFLAIFNTIGIFFLLRVFDEFKDKEDDAKFRKYLPVPRGLISLTELRNVGIGVFVSQIVVNSIFVPQILPLYALVVGYLLLMGKEFFVAEWLKKHQFWYVVSHMLIIPLVDVLASGFDWELNNVVPSRGLLLFFAVSFMNGVVLEIGRKIKTPLNEEEGVVSYTKLLGITGAPLTWLLLLVATLVLAILSSQYAGHSVEEQMMLVVLFVICSLSSLWFMLSKTQKAAKSMEIAAALWTLGMYILLGGIKMFIRF